MKIGLRAHDYGKNNPKDLMKSISEDGFKAIQLAFPKAIEGINSHDDVTLDIVKDVKTHCDNNDIEIAVLGCYIEPSYIDDKERQEEVRKFLRTMDFVKPLGAVCIGTETTHFRQEESKREEVYNLLLDSVKQMAKKAEEIDVIVAVEPVATHTLNTPELTRRLLDEVNSDNLKVIFDPVNLLTAENIKDQDELWERSFKAFGDKICALHIKGTRLKEDGTLEKTSLKDSDVHYDKIINWFKKNKPDVTILREEIQKETSVEDLEFIKNLLV